MTIGDIDLGVRPVLLAPMEDVTDASFRGICREQGADMVFTEFIPSEGLIRDAKKAYAKLKTTDAEAPIGIQIYGSDPDAMVEAAKMADHAPELVGGHGCDVIDINFGCPREQDRWPWSWLGDDEGWDEGSKIIVELAERLQDTGIKALTIHGRTRCQMYKGEADWTLIGEVKRNPRMHIPIIGPEKLKTERRARKCSGSSIPPADLIVLDDAFQGMTLRAYFNIVLVTTIA